MISTETQGGDMKTAALATGGIGGFLVVKVGLRRPQVTAIARGAHLNAISRNKLFHEASGGKFTRHIWIATEDLIDAGTVEAITLGVTGGDLEARTEACFLINRLRRTCAFS